MFFAILKITPILKDQQDSVNMDKHKSHWISCHDYLSAFKSFLFDSNFCKNTEAKILPKSWWKKWCC